MARLLAAWQWRLDPTPHATGSPPGPLRRRRRVGRRGGSAAEWPWALGRSGPVGGTKAMAAEAQCIITVKYSEALHSPTQMLNSDEKEKRGYMPPAGLTTALGGSTHAVSPLSLLNHLSLPSVNSVHCCCGA